MTAITKSTRVWEGVTAETFVRDIKPLARPAILKGLVSHWPAVQRAGRSAEDLSTYILDFYSGVPTPYFEGPAEIDGRFFYNDRMDGFNFTSARLPLTDIIRRLLAAVGVAGAPAMYAGSVSIPIYLPDFARDNARPDFIQASQVLESIWIGNQTCIPAHFDNTENIACVVGGRRRFTMFPMSETPNLYMGPLDFTPAGQPVSMVDIRRPDLVAYPRFEQAAAAGEVAELEPGDALYIPTLWWHSVEALEDFNVLVNYWWRDAPDHAGSPLDALLHAVLSLKSLPDSQRANWKALFDHLIFQVDGPALNHLPENVRGLLAALTPDKAERIRALLVKSLSRRD